MDREISKEVLLRRKRRKIIYVGASLAAVSLVASMALWFATPTIDIARLSVGPVTRGIIETSVSGIGRVVPAFEMIINSPVASRINEVYCNAGDTLAEGTPLLQLDLKSAETEIRALDDERNRMMLESEQTALSNHTYLANLEMQIKVKAMDVVRLRQEVISEQRLDSIGSGTGDRVRQARYAYDTALLELEQLRKQLANERGARENSEKIKQLELDIFDKNYSEKRRTLEDAKLRSPRAATLTYINNRIGAQVGQGERVAVIADLSHFKVSAEISDAVADRVVPGADVMVKIGSTTISGRVGSVAPMSKNGVISFDVTLDDDSHPRLRSGLRVDVHVMCDLRDDALRIPKGPYYRGAGDYTMFVIGEKELRARKVKLGDSNYEFVEVLSGLQEGEAVITVDMNDYTRKSKLKIK